MALYRLRGVTKNEIPYVYTNPDPTTKISHRDRAFVLGIDIPDSLQGDKYESVEKNKEVEIGGVQESDYLNLDANTSIKLQNLGQNG